MDIVLAAVLAAVAGATIARLAVGAGSRRRLAAEVARHRQTTEALRQAETETRILEHDLARERQASAEKLALLEGAHERLKVEFKALSADVLRENTSQFLALAEERLTVAHTRATGDLDDRRQAVEHLVAPLGEALTKMEDRLETIERARQNAYSTLTEQVRALHDGHERLRTETGNLVTALRSPATRGRWGEIQLRRVVEMAGMLHHCDFTEQSTLAGEQGRLRPDIVVHLPGGKTVVVDAKAPLEGYLDAVGAQDDAQAKAKFVVHARQLRAHVDKLAAKSYWESLANAPDFVVLFLPSDQLLSAALEHDGTLMEHAVANRVLLATPVTLIALLRSVAYGWQQQALADNARRIADLGREMHDRLARFAEHLAKVGRGLDSAVEAYNASVGSFESRVLVTARRFGELEVSDRELPEVGRVDRSSRAVTSASVDLVLLEGEGQGEGADAAPAPLPDRALPHA